MNYRFHQQYPTNQNHRQVPANRNVNQRPPNQLFHQQQQQQRPRQNLNYGYQHPHNLNQMRFIQQPRPFYFPAAPYYVIPPSPNPLQPVMSVQVPNMSHQTNLQANLQPSIRDVHVPNRSVADGITREREASKNKDDDDKRKKHSKKWKKSERPLRGYVIDDIYRKRKFKTVGHHSCYTQNLQEGESVEVAITESLLELHHRFIKHRLSLDDCSNSPNKGQVHENVPYNSANDDNICGCGEEERSYGIHHDIFPITKHYAKCDPYKRDTSELCHYRLVISPETNFVTRDPTTIYFDGKDFCFEGYSLFSHEPLDDVPSFCFVRNNIDYKIELIKDEYVPVGFCIKDLDLVCDYFFLDVMELYDWDIKKDEQKDKCQMFHLMPRFVHRITDLTQGDGSEDLFEMLSMSEVFEHCIEAINPVIETDFLNNAKTDDWKDFSKGCHGSLVLNPKKKPRVIRVDDIIRSKNLKSASISHSSVSLKFHSKEAKKEFMEVKDLLNKAIRAVKSRENARKEDLEVLWKRQNEYLKLKEKRAEQKYVEVEVNCNGYCKTGLRWDICQHASYLPSLLKYIKYIISLQSLEKIIKYEFKDKSLLKTALTHPSHVDQHAITIQVSNMIQNLGKQYPRIEKNLRPDSLGVKKKGALNVVDTMATLLNPSPEKSSCLHNERLEFLGDSVLDYVSSFHLFLMFPNKTPGELTEFRSSLVQATTLQDIGKKLKLHHYLLVNHRFAEMSFFNVYIGNAVEALIAAIYLDSSLKEVDEFLSHVLFPSDDLRKVWNSLKPHPLQEDYPNGDRHVLEKDAKLKKFVNLEESVGIHFKHIRLLIKAFTQSGLHNKKIVNGDYQRLEFLGDAILKFLTSDFLYKQFPRHQEGHLTLLRSSLVNARCLATASRELNFPQYLRTHDNSTSTIAEKTVSDLFESFLGAIRIDKDIRHCRAVIDVCLFSQLEDFIINQEWLDPKSQLSQCFDNINNAQRYSSDPSPQAVHPKYKRIKERILNGVRHYKVGVYYKHNRLGTGEGTSIKEAEKAAARDALMIKKLELWKKSKSIPTRQIDSRRNVSSTNDGRKRRHNDVSSDDARIQYFSPDASRHHESDEGAETLESSEGEQEPNEGELYDTVFNIQSK